MSLLPNWIDQPQLRHSHLDGDRLTLTAHTPQPDGAALLSTLDGAERAVRPPKKQNDRAALESHLSGRHGHAALRGQTRLIDLDNISIEPCKMPSTERATVPQCRDWPGPYYDRDS